MRRLLCQLAVVAQVLTLGLAQLSLGSLAKPLSSALNPLGSSLTPVGFKTNPLGSNLNPLNVGTNIWDQTFGSLTNLSSDQIGKKFLENSIPGIRHRIVTDVPSGGHKLAEIFQDSTDKVIECNLLGDRDLIEGALQLIPKSLVTNVTELEMEYFVDLCYKRKKSKTKPQSIFNLISDTFKSLFIFPGTKWCGAGDVAKNYDDLGPAKNTDRCCRDHDHAHDSISAFNSKYGITNINLYTMTHCKDDRRFYYCLLDDSSIPSATVGKIFFNVLRTKCFDYTFPKRCTKNNQFYIPLLTEKCKEYRLDTSLDKEWQTFSPPNFLRDYWARKRQATPAVIPPPSPTQEVKPSEDVPQRPPEHGHQDTTSASRPGLTTEEPHFDEEEPEEEPEEPPFDEEDEPDSWDRYTLDDISPDVTEEPVWNEPPAGVIDARHEATTTTTKPKPLSGSLFASKPAGGLGGLG